jgi:sugar lactone lactonase YvrE
VYVTHIHDDAVDRIDPDGTVRRVADLPSTPISTAFAADETMIVSSLDAGKLWRIVDGMVTELTDLSALSDDHWGDIVIATNGRIYIANQGMAWPDRMPTLEDWDSQIFLLAPNEAPRRVADRFMYANGLAITPDGGTLVVAESFGQRLWRMPIHEDGSLGAKELVFQFDGSQRPDGICCDAEGAIWSANAPGRTVTRHTLYGEMTHRITTEDMAIGCILGGADGCDLFITTAPSAHRDEARQLRGATLWRTRADVPAGGRP